jgi:hypothetical protein
MADEVSLTASDIALLNAPDHEFLDIVGAALAESTYFETEELTLLESRSFASEWLQRQYVAVRKYLCTEEVLAKTAAVPPLEATQIVLDVMVVAVTEEHKLLVSSMVLLKFTAIFCVRHGLRRLCRSDA